ncbi:MAG: nickel-dependent hydrogenase large subunit [Burkholderiales bacterium]
MTRLVIGPFNRVEGDLEVTLDVRNGQVLQAYVNSPLYRGFEEILQGKPALDALIIVPRICGICSVSQSAAAAQALRALMQIEPPPNGRLAECLVTACENMADHLTHFYLFFMPDFARGEYQGKSWFGRVESRFKAVSGSATAAMLPARASFMHIMGLMAGKWPHTLSLQPGGSACPLAQADVLQLLALLAEFRRFLERHLFGDRLEAFAALESMEALASWQSTHKGDLPLFLEVAENLSLESMGKATDRFLSYGAYDAPEGRVFCNGVWDKKLHPFTPSLIREDVSHAWMGGEERAPDRGITQVLPDKPGAYTWCKAPRYDHKVMETGALARQAVSGHPLIRDLLARHGGSVLGRVLARLLELAIVVPRMESWARSIQTAAPWCLDVAPIESGNAMGLIEAARGSLGHWVEVKQGRIVNYQIIAPTTWNFSPRDVNEVPGALEQALAGLWVRDGETSPVAAQHVVRSFDPCMVCTVH